ncbi:MAG: hypothetical protein ASARMPREDX12_006537 [Alectoria sarmentosa]|nr:MAG: hypothetical protein ASARMPREDX12_006537 [Alectoria sarmentosa]
MPREILPTKVFSIRHREGKETRVRPCVHFVAYGRNHGPPQIRFPTVLTLDLSKNEPPPERLCGRLTGLDYEIADSFFSFESNDLEFYNALNEIQHQMKSRPRGGCVAVLINCMEGIHRSVAMAERLARAVRSRDGPKAECLHLDLGKGMKIRPESAARMGAMGMSEDIPARGRRRLRHKAQGTRNVRSTSE